MHKRIASYIALKLVRLMYLEHNLLVERKKLWLKALVCIVYIVNPSLVFAISLLLLSLPKIVSASWFPWLLPSFLSVSTPLPYLLPEP